MHKIRIFDIALTKAGFVLFLSESNTSPTLPIVIGISEAQSITVALNDLKPERPLSHDTFKKVMNSLQANVIKVVISNCSNGTFFADMYLSTNDGTLIMDCRPSDAIALAARFKAPVYVTDEVMDEAGVGPEAKEAYSQTEIDHSEVDFQPVSQESVLKGRLRDAVRNEKFEEAALLRDQINKLKESH